MRPVLVEQSIINIMNEQLVICNKNKFMKNSLLFNLGGFLIIILIISIILYIKYKGKQDFKTIKDRENKKRNYILSKLKFYQNIKTKEFTNIPI
jgi:hypothetical protein